MRSLTEKKALYLAEKLSHLPKNARHVVVSSIMKNYGTEGVDLVDSFLKDIQLDEFTTIREVL